MDKTPKSISLSCNNDDGVPEATGMETVLSDLNALKKLYGLLQRLDETSRALLKKLLDDATRQALLKQANSLTTTSDSVIPFSLGLASPKKMNQATSSSSSFVNNKEAEMGQILSDLQVLTRLYMLLHKGTTDENLDEASKALLMKILEGATQEAVRRQAKMLSSSQVSPMLERKLSKRSDCQIRHADPRLMPMVSPGPRLLAGERSQKPNRQKSSVSTSRSGLHVDAAEEPPLARLASKCSSRTALRARHRPSQEQRHSSLSLHRSHVPGTSQHGTATGGARSAHRWDSIRSSSGRGDQWTLEHSSSSWRSLSREVSLEPSSSPHGRATPRHVGTESSPSFRLFERLDSGLSVSTTSRHGMEHVGRGVATPERSSSSNTMATIQSRIRPSNSLHVSRSPRRSAEAGRRTSRERHVSDVSSADTYSSSVSSGRRSSSGAASLSASTSPPPSPPPPRAFATPYYSPPVTTAPRGAVPPPRAFAPPYYPPPATTASRGVVLPVYAPKVSRSMRRRHRQEILEKRVARLRMIKDKIATMFHHHHDHDHHHHHHHLRGGQEAGLSSRAIVHGAGHVHSPWQYLTSMFHHAKGKVKNTRSRAVAGVPEKRRGGGGGGGGNMHALFDAVRRHLKGKRSAPAGMKLKRKASWSRARAKKMHWWQQLSRRRGVPGVTAGSRPRHRLGHGKAGWL